MTPEERAMQILDALNAYSARHFPFVRVVIAISDAHAAGFREGVEKAAKACEAELIDEKLPLTLHGQSRNEGCRDCAAAIRSLEPGE